MMNRSVSTAYCIGWDVGAWHCDRNPRSRDALCVLDAQGQMVGDWWRGSLRQSINDAGNARDWVDALFRLCGVACPGAEARIVLAIDAPLGFPEAFLRLLNNQVISERVDTEARWNPYLYRQTERLLLRNRFTPLSAVKDMIGSQATKAMHALAKFSVHARSPGVWSHGSTLEVIEAYPAPCQGSKVLACYPPPRTHPTHKDAADALTCARVAHLFAYARDSLLPPTQDVPTAEGWIWLPRDVFPDGQPI